MVCSQKSWAPQDLAESSTLPQGECWPNVVSGKMVFNFCLHGIEDLPIPAVHFVLICNEAQGLPWQTGGNNQQKYCVTIGWIQDVGNIPDRPYMDFYLPPEEFILPKQNNIAMITTGPCVGIKEVVKTQHHGHVDSADILDIAFVLTVKYIEKAMAVVALGISSFFVTINFWITR